ncbi:endolytic transglycosylase MltG [Flavobacterium sp.]|uniref:endolytic transglycosylase MltG n=1 Tax=Flavobacterium sp. TaxID=239 RepID=UPI00375379BC
MNKKIKLLLGIGFALFLIASTVIYFKFFASNTNLNKEEVYVTIPTNSNYEEAKKIISPFIENIGEFELMASLRKYDKNVKSGRFLIKKGMGNFALVATLRKNVPVNLAFNNQERLQNLCARVSSQIEPDTTKLIAAFTDATFLKENQFNKDNVFSIFIPNSYEFYWNVSAEKFRDKMLSEYKKFWTKERLIKAKQLNMTPVEVITLASIVHKETVKADERPKVAKVYLNRLEQGMPLQADPTVIYSLKLRDNNFDQVIKRVLYDDLLIASPYNTYVNIGLPPGPIAMPDISAIDAVLSPDNNDYIYFCASIERFGYHEFASTYAQHQLNAAKYSKWLNEQGTKR